ncbi:unnamed protein product [Victoria cruziana]
MAVAWTTVAAIALYALVCLVIPISAKQYTVGDDSGWDQGYDYSQWTQGKTFVVGDSLVFNYGSLHSVYEVPSADYASCSSTNAVSTDSSGSTTIPLKAAGAHYFICGTLSHCMNGMKMSVTVSKAGSPTTPSPSTTTTTATATNTGSLQAPAIGGAVLAALAALFA